MSVAAGGLICWFSWGDEVSASKSFRSAAASVERSAKRLSEEGARAPSSINKALTQSISPPQTKAIDQLVKFDLNCRPLKGDPVDLTQGSLARGPQSFNRLIVRGGFVQLHGKSCLKLKDKSSPIITNITNGFQGVYFQAGQGNYKTDLIQLNEGENKIKVEFQNSAGKKYDLSFLVISHRI